MTNEQLIKAYRKGDKTALEQIILQNKGFVHRLANYYASMYKGGDKEDLIQEGYIGLMRAVETYNPRKSKFLTYAFYWIRNAMVRAIKKQPTIVSLDEPVAGEEDDITLGDMLADDYNFIAEIEDRLTLESLWPEIRKKMPPLQFKVFVLWVYGYSIDHIAGRLGLTLEEAKQQKQKALRSIAIRSAKVRKLAREWLESRTPSYYTATKLFDSTGYRTNYKKDSIVERIVIARDEAVNSLIRRQASL